jgi:hypothetical protein
MNENVGGILTTDYYGFVPKPMLYLPHFLILVSLSITSYLKYVYELPSSV